MQNENKNRAIELKENGKTAEEIAVLLGVHERTIYKWVSGANATKAIADLVIPQTIEEAHAQLQEATFTAIAVVREAHAQLQEATFTAIAVVRHETALGKLADGGNLYLRLGRTLEELSALNNRFNVDDNGPDNPGYYYTPEGEAELNKQISALVEKM